MPTTINHSDGKHVAVYYHTHWDREWYWPFRQYQIKLAEVIDAVLDRLDSGLIPCFTLDGQTIVLEDYLELRPNNKQRLYGYIQSGHISVGPWYVLPDEFLVSGESLIRNLQRGIALSRESGCNTFTGYMPDSFGHPADMPMVFKKFGVETGLTWRGVAPTHSEFVWQSPNGDSLLMYYLAKGYGQHFLHEGATTHGQKTKALTELLSALRQRAGSNEVLLPIGCDHLGPPTAEVKEILNEVIPNFKELNPPQFLEQLQRQKLNGKLSTIEGDLRDNTESYTLQGVYSARLYLKQHNRVLEHRLIRQLEPMLAMPQVFLPSPPLYPQHEMDLAWKLLLQNHPHDSICGCSVDIVHFENETRFENVVDITETLSLKQFHHLSSQLAQPSHWLAINTGDTPYTGVVWARETSAESPTQLHQLKIEETVLEDSYIYNFNELPLADKTMKQRIGWLWVDDVPAHGYKLIPRTHQPTIIAARASTSMLENEHLLVSIETDGSVSVTEKATGKTWKQLHTYTSRPEQGDSYNSAPVPGSQTYNAKLDAVAVLSDGPLVAEIEVAYTIAEVNLQLSNVVSLQAGARRVEFETAFTNTTPDHKLQVWFKTDQPVWSVEAERHFGVDKRTYDPNYNEEPLMPVEALKELRTNTGPVQRFFSTNGQSFITQGLTEYEVQKNKIGITLLRAFGMLSKADTGVRGGQAGPPFPTPDGQCVGRHMHLHYAWLPQPEKTATLYAEANQFYSCAIAEQGRANVVPLHILRAAQSRSLINWDNPHVVSSAVKWTMAPHQGLLLRLTNTTAEPQPVTLTPGFEPKSAYIGGFDETQLLPLSGFNTGKPASLTLKPLDTVTLVFALK